MFEKVNPAHPDKLADRIAGALVDLAYKNERAPRIAVEVLIGHGCCHIICETSTHLKKKDVKAEVWSIIEFSPLGILNGTLCTVSLKRMNLSD